MSSNEQLVAVAKQFATARDRAQEIIRMQDFVFSNAYPTAKQDLAVTAAETLEELINTTAQIVDKAPHKIAIETTVLARHLFIKYVIVVIHIHTLLKLRLKAQMH